MSFGWPTRRSAPWAAWPGFFACIKHNHYRDFGFPETLGFQQLYEMYLRNGIAHAGVTKTIEKTRQDQPFLLDRERDGSEGKAKDGTELEKQIRLRFEKLRVWQHLAEADTCSMAGAYAGVILRLADSKTFDQPAEFVPGGLLGPGRAYPGTGRPAHRCGVGSLHDLQAEATSYRAIRHPGRPRSAPCGQAGGLASGPRRIAE